MANIIEENLMAALNDEPSEKAAESTAKKITEEMGQDSDTDVAISYHYEKGTDGASIQAAGRGRDIINGMCILLGSVALRIAGNKKGPAREIVAKVSGGARIYIDEGGGIGDAQDCAEKTEN